MKTVGVLCLACIALALNASQAAATHVNCGDTITQDTTLDSDLLNCPENGVVIGAPGTTLDLAGHLIHGPDPHPALGWDFPPDGVNNREGHTNVTVQNGTIRGFQTGVSVGNYDSGPALAEGVVVRNLDISSVHGLGVEHASGLLVEGNRITAYDYPMRTVDSRATRLIENTFEGTIVGSWIPMFASSRGISGDDVVEGNSFLGVSLSMPGPGSRAHRNVLTSKRLGPFHTATTGIAVRNRSMVSRNVISGAYNAVTVGDGSVVSRNVISDSHYGIYQPQSRDPAREVTLIDKNSVSDSTGDGFWIGGKAELTANTAVRSAGDGFHLDHWSDAIVTRNRANSNGDLGIEAVLAIDGGGNKASGNGNPLQCVGVTCK